MYKLIKGTLLYSGERPGSIVQDNLVVIDVSTETSITPFSIFRNGGSFSFQVKSNLGNTIQITSIDVPVGDTVVTSLPLNVGATPVTIDFTGFSSGDIVIHHNGLNNPFTVNATLGS